MDSLQPLQALCDSINQKYGGTPMIGTEPVFNYQAKACGLKMLDAEGDFQKATQDGNDPPAFAVVKFRDQLNNRVAKVLMFNNQAVTQMSQQMADLAELNGVPVVGMSETMPPKVTYQQWMTNQLQAMLQALGG